MNYMRDANLDVAVVSESGVGCLLPGIAHASGYTLVSVERPFDAAEGGDGGPAYARRVGGGLAVLVRHGLAVRVDAHDRRGAIALRVSRRGFHPVAVIGAYLPPLTSAASRVRRVHWRGPLLGFVANAYRRLSLALGTDSVLIAGDLNWHWGKGPRGDWGTADVRRGHLPFHAWAANLGVAPIHGRVGLTAVFRSSRSHGQAQYSASPDFILAAADLAPPAIGADEEASQPSPFGGRQAHLPVVASLRLRPRAEPPALRPARRLPRAWYLPAFGARAWGPYAEALGQLLPVAAAFAADPAVPATDSARAISAALLGAANATLGRPEVSARERARRGVAGAPLPPAVRQLCADARDARAAHQRAWRAGWTVSELVPLRGLARAAHRIARAATRRAVRARMKAHAMRLARLRISDQHAFAVWMDGSSSRDGLTRRGVPPIPEAGGVGAAVRFREFGARLFAAAPEPPGPSDEQHMRFVPTPDPPAGQPWAGAPSSTTADVYLAVWGSAGAPPGGLADFQPCSAHCRYCLSFAEGLREQSAAPLGAPPPEWPDASLHTSVAAGACRVPAELLRWWRVGPDSCTTTFALRWQLAEAMRDALAKVPRDGLQGEYAATTIYSLMKPAKPGQHPDPADPAAYRNIAVAALLSKVLSLLMLARLRHYAEGCKLLPPTQASSRMGLGAEHHVFALSSFLRLRRRLGLSTYVAYVDFAKAFDRVSPSALEAVLRRMGVPDDFLQLLRVWRAGRQGSMVVNGVATDPFPLEAGVPQGCPLSPLLFNLYLAGLSRFLDDDAGGAGASALDARLRHLVFADDLAVVAETPAALQRALDRVHQWSLAWGMEVSVGPSKTEGQAFLTPEDAETGAALPALTVGAAAVQWVTEYRYLGYALRSDLDDSVALARVVSQTRAAYARLFRGNPVLRTMPVGVQLQILKGHVVAASEYLRCLLDPTGSSAAELDTIFLGAARGILCWPKTTAAALVWAVSGLVPAEVLAARARARLALALSSRDGIVTPATLIYAALMREPETQLTRRWSAVGNVVHVLRRLHARDCQKYDASVPETGHSSDRAREFGRYLAVAQQQVALRLLAAEPQQRAARAAKAAAAAAAEASAAVAAAVAGAASSPRTRALSRTLSSLSAAAASASSAAAARRTRWLCV